MNIKEKLKQVKLVENDIILVLTIVFVALIAFGLGRLSAISDKKEPIVIENLNANVANLSESEANISELNEYLYVASKNGSKYHFPWCSGAQSIKEENKIYFKTKEEAEKAGYTPASNCKGL